MTGTRYRWLLECVGLGGAVLAVVIGAGIMAKTGEQDPFTAERLAQLHADVESFDGQLGDHPGIAAACVEAREKYNAEAATANRLPDWLPRQIDVQDPGTDCRAS